MPEEIGQRSAEISSISRSACILVCLSTGKNSITEIANHCGFSKPTVHRLLKAMEVPGMVRRDPVTRQYYLGHLIERIHSYPEVVHERLITCALDEMKRLSNISEETVALGLRFGISYLHLYEIPSKHDLRITESGRPMPAFIGPAARVLLSQSSDKELEKIMKVIKLEKITENTITDKGVFLEQVKDARRQGYALSYGERIPGALGISAPILNYHLPAAMTILAFEYRIKSRVKELTTELIRSTSQISNNLAEYSI